MTWKQALRGLPLIGLLVPAALFGQAQDGRLDPGIRELLRPEVREQIRRTIRLPLEAVAAVTPQRPGEPASGALQAAGGLALDRVTPGGEARVGIIVRVRTPSAVQELRAAGAQIGVVVGDIATAWVPLSALESVASIASLERVEAARTLTTVHDTSMIAIQADGLRQLVGDAWVGATGAGVIVGIYDTGLDLHHGDFLDPAGRTRVLALWDQVNSQSNPPPGFTQGYFCTQAEIQRRIDTGATSACPQNDAFGHGTHVAGTAAGDGSAPGSGPLQYRFAGVAPVADLLIVRGGPGIFFENLIVEGLAFMKGQAEQHGKPAVVNLSLGGQFGPHDGSRLYEQVIDELSGPGFAVVISAGNQGYNGNTTPALGERLIHARGIPTGQQFAEFDVELCLASATSGCQPYTRDLSVCRNNAVDLDIWYDAADRLKIEVFRPGGTTPVAASLGSRTEGNDPGGHIVIDNGSSGPNPENGDIEAIIQIDGCGTSGAPEAGTWKIRVTPETPGSGQPYDMWIFRAVVGFDGAARGRAGFDNRFIVASPGNATEAITVGAFATRMCWPSQSTSGQTCYAQREQIGDLARFSSAGPRRDGVLKPEIVAPGIGIVSSRSRDITPAATRLLPDNAHWVIEGTSMSAPHVTGAIALLFQANRNLDPATLKSVFQATSTQDAFTGRTYGVLGTGALPSDWWGYGKLNVRDALLALSSTPPAVLAIDAGSAVPDSVVVGRRGSRLPLLEVNLESKGEEEINVLGLTFRVTGSDSLAWLTLVRDANRNGVADPSEVALDSARARLTGRDTVIQITVRGLRVPPNQGIGLIAALRLSGTAPHGSAFSAELVAPATVSVGIRSLARNPLDILNVVASGSATTSVLRSDQGVALSANPVRGTSVFFQFAEPPTKAAVYTLAGRRVIDLLPDLAGGRTMQWRLTNDEGHRVAPGVYLVIFTVGGRTFREKLIVLTPADDASANPE